MPNLRYELETQLAASWPPADWDDVTVLLAVSGGCDSVALLRAMAALKGAGKGRLCVAHLNHQLRRDADADEAFVVDLCRQWAIPCTTGRVVLDQQPDGLEAAARAARYQFLADTAAQMGARFVVTAHTADDQAETILQRIVRGTGIGGLAGMSRVRPLGHATLIRPLLTVGRADLEAYLSALQQPFCTDSSNADLQFTRNRIRRELLPRLAAQFNPGVKDALLRLGALAGEAQAVIDAQIAALAKTMVKRESPDAVSVELARLTEQPRYVQRELLLAAWRGQGWPLQAMGYAQWEQLAAMAAAAGAGTPTAAQIFPGNVRAEAVTGRLRLARS